MNNSQHWQGKQPDPQLWEKLKPLAREMRREPTPAEEKLWGYLRRKQRLGYKFRRQHVIERFIVDFYCSRASLIVEVDGKIHRYNIEQDKIRTAYLENLGLTVLRFQNEEIMMRVEQVVAQIDEYLKSV